MSSSCLVCMKKSVECKRYRLQLPHVSPFMCVCLSAATWVGGGFILGIAEATYNPTLGAVWALMPVPYVLTFFLGESHHWPPNVKP